MHKSKTTIQTTQKRHRKRGTHKKFAKGTGGYGPIDDDIPVRLPTLMKDALGKLASANDYSREAYTRILLLKGIDSEKELLKARGGTPPLYIGLIRWTPWHLRYAGC